MRYLLSPVPLTALALLGLLAGAAAAPAAAQDAPGRYSMSPTDGGFLRLDTQTGTVSFCNRRNDQWACTGVTDDGLALRQEVEKLKARNAELEIEVKRLDELVGLRDKDGPKDGKSPERHAERPSLPNLQLPTEKDVDSALDYLGRMFRKFRDKLKDLEDPDRKGTKI